MSLRETIREWSRPAYFLGQNLTTLTGAMLTTSIALTMIAFWFYDFVLPGSPHPHVGILIFVILPGFFVLGLALIPLGIWLRRRSLCEHGELPSVFPAIDLGLPVVRHTLEYVAAATVLNLLIVETESYRGVQYMDSTEFCGQTWHWVRNVFPDMRATWGAHPNNLGHNDSPGCFRCHDGSHTSADGQTVTNDCSA